jgi:hypothetical protein
MGIEGFPLAVPDSQPLGRFIGISHGIGLGPAVGVPHIHLVLRERRGVAVRYAESPGWRGSGGSQESEGKGPETPHANQNAQNRLLFPQLQEQE